MTINLSNISISKVSARTTTGAPFVPVTLVQENWIGLGPVAGRTPEPISGGGVWEIDLAASSINFEPNYAFAIDGYGIFRHSVAFTDATITATVFPSNSSAGATPVYIWARSTPGASGSPTSGYYVILENPISGSTPVITLRKLISNVETIIGSSEVDPTGQLVSFTVSGSTLTVKVNGTTAIQVTDSSITAAGYWGYIIASLGNDEESSQSQVGPIIIQTA